MPKKNNTITFNFVGDFTPSTKNDLLTSTPATYGGMSDTRLQLSFGVKVGSSVQFVSLLDTSRSGDVIKTYDRDNNPIDVRWSDRLDPDVISKVAPYRTYRTNIGSDETKTFITGYDLAEYLAEALKNYTGRITVNGRMVLRYDSKGILRRNFNIDSVWKPLLDKDGEPVEKPKLAIMVPFIFNKDCIDKADLKETGKIYVNGYVESYINKDEGDKYLPLQMIFNTAVYNMDDPGEKSTYEYRMGELDTKAKTMFCMMWEGRVVNGAEEKPFDESCLTPFQLRSIKAGNVTLNDFRPRGSIYGNRVQELRLMRPMPRDDFKDGPIDLGLKNSEFVDLIYTPTKDESVADMEKSAKKEPETPPFTAPTSRDEDELF